MNKPSFPNRTPPKRVTVITNDENDIRFRIYSGEIPLWEAGKEMAKREHIRAMAWKTLHDIKCRANNELLQEIKMLQQEKEKDVDLITPSGNVVPMRRKGTTQPPAGTDNNWLSPLQVGDVFLAQRFQQRPDGTFALAPILEEYQISVNEKEYVKLLTTLNLDDTEITVDPVEFCKGWNLKALIGHVTPE